MFSIQPGQGLGRCPSAELALGLGIGVCEGAIAPPVIQDVIPWWDQGAGAKKKISVVRRRRLAYEEEIRRKVLQEEQELLEILIAMIEGNLI